MIQIPVLTSEAVRAAFLACGLHDPFKGYEPDGLMYFVRGPRGAKFGHTTKNLWVRLRNVAPPLGRGELFVVGCVRAARREEVYAHTMCRLGRHRGPRLQNVCEWYPPQSAIGALVDLVETISGVAIRVPGHGGRGADRVCSLCGLTNHDRRICQLLEEAA